MFLVIEYVNGGDLMFHMQRQRKLPEEHARWVQPGAGWGTWGGGAGTWGGGGGVDLGKGHRGSLPPARGQARAGRVLGVADPPEHCVCDGVVLFPVSEMG